MILTARKNYGIPNGCAVVLAFGTFKQRGQALGQQSQFPVKDEEFLYSLFIHMRVCIEVSVFGRRELFVILKKVDKSIRFGKTQ